MNVNLAEKKMSRNMTTAETKRIFLNQVLDDLNSAIDILDQLVIKEPDIQLIKVKSSMRYAIRSIELVQLFKNPSHVNFLKTG